MKNYLMIFGAVLLALSITFSLAGCSDGAAGPAGIDGRDGVDGKDGTNGNNWQNNDDYIAQYEDYLNGEYDGTDGTDAASYTNSGKIVSTFAGLKEALAESAADGTGDPVYVIDKIVIDEPWALTGTVVVTTGANLAARSAGNEGDGKITVKTGTIFTISEGAKLIVSGGGSVVVEDRGSLYLGGELRGASYYPDGSAAPVVTFNYGSTFYNSSKQYPGNNYNGIPAGGFVSTGDKEEYKWVSPGKWNGPRSPAQ